MLILLDIDGVMVPAKGWKRPDLLSDGFPAFSNRAVHVLNNLITDNTTVVLTTSHKSNHTIDEWRNIFRNRGIKASKFSSLDANYENLSRKDEILKWFATHNLNEEYIILDDDTSLNSLPAKFKRNLLLTSPYVGLTEEHLKEAKVIINRDLHLA